MALPTILFNSSTGSDSAASGAGPSTALTGSGASLASSTSIDLSADAPDLSGVATDGSAVLWVQTSSGRQFFKIVNTNNTTKVVTVANAATVTEASRLWAIGGKRATFDATNSRTLFGSVGALSGWEVVAETDQPLTSALVIVGVHSAGDGRLVIRGDGTRRLINQSANAYNFDFTAPATSFTVRGLKFSCSNGSKSSNAAIRGTNASASLVIEDCVLGDATNQLRYGFERGSSFSGNVVIRDSDVVHCTSHGITSSAGVDLTLAGSVVAFNGGAGVTGTGIALRMQSSIVAFNAGVGVLAIVQSCIYSVIHGNGSHGIDTSSAAAMLFSAVIYGNNITGNGGYGINAHAQGVTFVGFLDYNNYGASGTANTSGALQNLTAGAGSLSVDPDYANAAGLDFTTGSSVKAKGFPDAARYIGANVAGTVGFYDIGIQQEATGGGSGPDLSNTLIVGGT